MSVHLTSDVWRNSKASGTTLLVLLSIADQANDEGYCWPSVSSIAQRCRVHRSTIQRHLTDLRDLGELTWEDRHADGKSSIYRITLSQSATPLSQSATPPLSQSETRGVATVRQGCSTVATTGIINESSENQKEPTQLDQDTLVPSSAGLTDGAETKRSSRKKPKRSFPEGWVPNEKHTEFAAANRLAVSFEAQRFQANALAHDRQYSDWDAAFRNWMINQVGYRAEREERGGNGRSRQPESGVNSWGVATL